MEAGWVSAGAGELIPGGSWSSGHGAIDASAAAQLVPLSLPHTDIHTVPSTKQALSCYGVFITNVPCFEHKFLVVGSYSFNSQLDCYTF